MRDLIRKLKILIVFAPVLCGYLIGDCNVSSAANSWNGVDEAVVEKISREHGREAKAPLIDPGSGDLLLFVFLAAGACGGFVAGYYWRELVGKKERPR